MLSNEETEETLFDSAPKSTRTPENIYIKNNKVPVAEGVE